MIAIIIVIIVIIVIIIMIIIFNGRNPLSEELFRSLKENFETF